jgi:hypothetical protein
MNLELILVPTYLLGWKSAFLEISVVYTANKRDNFQGRRVVVLKQVFANKYSCVAESETLVINTSVEKVHFQVVKFV